MMRSLRLRLVLLAFLSALIGWAAAAGLAYFRALHQVHRLFDTQLSLVAELLSAHTRHELEELDLGALEGNMLGDERPGPVAFQVWWRDGCLLLRTANAPREPLGLDVAGYQDREADARIWRVFVKRDLKDEFEVHVGAPHAALDRLARRLFWEDMAPVTISVPITVLLLGLGIQLGLAPLVRIAREVAARGHRRLDPICVEGVPSEARPIMDALNGLFTRLDHAFSREARFTSDCAHEMRAPLTGIRTQVQVALRAADEDGRRRALEQTLVAVDRGTHLVEQLLALARSDPEAAPWPLSPVDLIEVVRPVLEDLARAALARGIELHLAAQECPPVPGNAEALAVMTRNLVDNSIRYSPPGSRVTVCTGVEEGQVCLNVEDDGPGISAEERERVFERFYRGPSAGARGSGLGLSIVRNIADIHCARVSLLTPPSGRGLRVQVCLPAADAPAAG